MKSIMPFLFKKINDLIKKQKQTNSFQNNDANLKCLLDDNQLFFELEEPS